MEKGWCFWALASKEKTRRKRIKGPAKWKKAPNSSLSLPIQETALHYVDKRRYSQVKECCPQNDGGGGVEGAESNLAPLLE